MSSVLMLIQQVRRRLLWHQQFNLLGIFLPLVVLSWIIGQLIAQLFALSRLFTLLPMIPCVIGVVVALWKKRATIQPEAIAALLDDKTRGKERFLTLVSKEPYSLSNGALYPVVQQQVEKLAENFLPEQEFPFVLDRRVPWVILGTAGSILFIFLLLPVFERSFVPSFAPQMESSSQEITSTAAMSALEETARLLLSPASAPEEQLAGAQLLTLLQRLQDPSLSALEKQRLIEEAQKRLPVDLPLPQLFPFDLKIFSNKGKEGQNQGQESGESQGGKAQLTKASQSLEQLKQALSGQMSSTPGQNEKKDEGKDKSPQPSSAGGGIKFNFPSSSPNQQSSQSNAPQTSGTQQSQPNNQTPSLMNTTGQPQNGLASKIDPNQTGNNINNQAQNSQNQGHNSETPGNEQGKKGEGGTTIGQGRGERFLRPGDKPGEGFLTKDAQFVKVRVPVTQDEQGQGETLTANTGRITPKTPYSNAPLKEGPPDQPQVKQPIPFEYRSILEE
jgi:hypothetical protein